VNAETPNSTGGASGPRRVVARLASLRGALALVIRYWALAGGAIVAALVVMTAASAILNLVSHKPIPGEYELVKHFIAIAIFTFLPYCQLAGANVTVDIFTEGASERARSAMVVFSSLLAALFALLLLRQMSLGFRDYIRYPETTATLGVPLWTAFPFILLSLLLLFFAALITGADGIRGMRGGSLPRPAPIVE
jgi:TRAP-type C4-dicarboxylate transport system permease small subunit